METRRHRRNLIIALILVLVVAVAGSCVGVWYYTQQNSYAKQLELADKYYAAQDYDNAIIYYQKAIQKDSSRSEGYIGLVNVYEARGNTVMALTMAQMGFTNTGSARLELMVTKFTELTMQTEETEAEQVVYETEETDETAEETQEDEKTASSSTKAQTTAGTGRVLSSTTGSGVYGATVTFYSGTNTSGTPVASSKTNSSGKYDVSLERGSYTAVVECSGYVTETFSCYVGSGKSSPSDNFVITPELQEGEIRIVLEWNSEPRDLDSYLSGTLDSGARISVNYTSKTATYGGEVVAELDVDDTTGYGPETTTIYDINGVYTFSVVDYYDTGTMGRYGATVKVYLSGESSPHTIEIPSSVTQNWTVCKIDHGELTIINSGDTSGGASSEAVTEETQETESEETKGSEETESEETESSEESDDAQADDGSYEGERGDYIPG
ncbi:MAG: hypothetical protein LUE87_12595 [Lachnospiraceae bacterium]|nr:hypothetical protein [Lachnospiraceae bacterium]